MKSVPGIWCLAGLLGMLCISCDNDLLTDLQAKIDRDRENSFVTFRFSQSLNPECSIDAEGTIEDDTVTVLIPVNTDVTSLIAEFEFNGKEVVVGDVLQESGVTPNDFTNPVVYTIRSLDGTSREYEVVVREAADNADLASIVIQRGTAGTYEPYLEPAFDTDETEYIYWVPNTVTYVTVAIATTDVNASAAIEGSDVGAEGSADVGLVDGPNEVEIIVTAEDGLVTQTYTMEVYRAIGIPRTMTAYSARPDDDGGLQMGVNWDQATRFVKQGDGTVLDTLTGLLWMEYAYPNQLNEYQWDAALDVVENLEHGVNNLADGSVRGDWRLPNHNEMVSLFCAADTDPGVWLDNHEFEEYRNTAQPFWTSTTVHGLSGSAFAWNSNSGATEDKAKSSGNPFRDFTAVRGPVQEGAVGIPVTGQTQTYRFGEEDDDGYLQHGVPFPVPRFIDNENGTITDRLTGFIWLEDWDLLSGGGDWGGAMTTVADLEDDGVNLRDGSQDGDWRLPNIREFISLTHFGFAGLFQHLTPEGFQNVPMASTYFWTSTHRGGDSSTVYRFNVYSQLIGTTSKGVSLRYTAVRSIE